MLRKGWGPFLRNAVRVGRVDEIAAVREMTASLTQKTGTWEVGYESTLELNFPDPRGDLLTSFSFQDDRYRWLIRIVGVDRQGIELRTSTLGLEHNLDFHYTGGLEQHRNVPGGFHAEVRSVGQCQ